jgi:uncharacterized membrane protein YqhA
MAQKEFDKNPGLVSDVSQFLFQSRKWYLLPIVFAIVLLGVLLILGSTAAAPFIYTLF